VVKDGIQKQKLFLGTIGNDFKMQVEDDAKEIFKRIRDCKGIDDCPGKSSPCPIVLAPKGEKVKIMVITEQPGKKTWENMEEKLGIPEPEIRELCTSNREELYERFREYVEREKGGALGELKKYLGDEFTNSIKHGGEKYYWTHFIKCPGQIREIRGNEKKEVCANTYLLEEIFALRPELILSFGRSASEWILRHSSLDKKNWRDYVKEEENRVEKGDFKAQKMEERLYEIAKETCIEAEDGKERKKHKTKVCFFFHPSGANPDRRTNRKIFDALWGRR